MITATVNGTTQFKVEKKPDGLFANGILIDWNMVTVDQNRFHVLHQNHSFTIDVISADTSSKTFKLKINNKLFEVILKDRFDDLLHELGMDNVLAGRLQDIKAPMPGLVLDVKVQNGQLIKKGDAVVVLEAMKMENILKASADAVVKMVMVKKGNKVEKNEILVTLQ